MIGRPGRPRPLVGLACLLPTLAVLLVALQASPAQEAEAVAAQVLSGPTPFGDCGGGGPGSPVPDAVVEPSIAAGGGAIVAAWQQDRWTRLGARGIVASVSRDGGRSWAGGALPLSACAPDGLPFERASDPWATIGSDGRLYVSAVLLTSRGRGVLPSDNAVVVVSSGDGGRSWSPPVLVQVDRATRRVFNDKATMLADPVRPGVAYVVWERLTWTSDRTGAEDGETGGGSGFRGVTMLATTGDGGLSWSVPRPIFEPGPNGEAFASQLLSAPDGRELYHLFTWADRGADGSGGTGDRVAIQRSSDGGQSWTGPIEIAPLGAVGVTEPRSGRRVRDGHRVATGAVDPRDGTLFAVWMDARFSGGAYDQVALARSSDAGGSWSEPLRVNLDSGQPAFSPAVAVTTRGALAISYYQLEAGDETATGTPVRSWLAVSRDGGRTFGERLPLTAAFDLTRAPESDGPFLGDYQGLAADGARIVALVTEPRPDGAPGRSVVTLATVQP